MKIKTSFGLVRSVVAIGAAMAMAASLVGCGGSSSDGSGAGSTVDRDATLRISYQVTQTLSPFQEPSPGALLIATWPVYDRLIQVGPEFTYDPMLATSWEFSPDGMSLTVELRDDVTFSDGERFDAAAVKANLDSYSGAKGTALQGAVALAGITNISVVDDFTVKIDLAKPSNVVLAVLASQLSGIMISPKALDNKDLSSHPVGTGAYVIDSFQPGQKVIYKRRTDEGGIWDDKTGKSAAVQILNFESADAQTNALKSGQVDLTVWSQGVERFQSELDSGKLVHTSSLGPNLIGINFNRTVKPFDNMLVRQAVNHAVDRDAIIDGFLKGSEARVQPWSSSLIGFDESREDAYSFDPAKAKELLAEAGYPDGLDGGEFLVPEAGALPKVAEVVQANLADVGIKIEVRKMDVYGLITAWSKANASAEVMYMNLDGINPYSWLQRLFVNPLWVPGGPDPAMATLIEGTDDSQITEEQRAEKVGKAIDYATENATYSPLWQAAVESVQSSKVKGDPASNNGGVTDFRNAYLVK